jgi:hypothetical protein
MQSWKNLNKCEKDANTIEFKSREAIEPVIMEYLEAEQVWHNFKERAITYNFEEIYQDMIYILINFLFAKPKKGR